MIYSVTYRQSDLDRVSNQEIHKCLNKFKRVNNACSHAKVTFSKDNHHQHHDSLVTCHISLFVHNFDPIDIYVHNANTLQAFHDAWQKAKKKLKRTVGRSRRNSHCQLSADNFGEIA